VQRDDFASDHYNHRHELDLNYNPCIAHLFGFGADLFDTEIA
jgi:hypothetical protein